MISLHLLIKKMSNLTKIAELKKKLSEEILKDNSDNNVMISLSNEIANLDESTVRFSVDAGLINRLGKELVGKQETAVSELIKNAYDADATVVDLIFANAWNRGGTLVIEDNGHGMNREQLVSGFMRLSSSDKIHNPVSEKYKRQKAGKKGNPPAAADARTARWALPAILIRNKAFGLYENAAAVRIAAYPPSCKQFRCF